MVGSHHDLFLGAPLMLGVLLEILAPKVHEALS
jgi:hypothetical protein